MITIEQRIVTLRICGKVSPAEPVKKLMNETADVLEALTAQYNKLAAAAKDAVSRSNGDDPAMQIIASELDEQGQLHKRESA